MDTTHDPPEFSFDFTYSNCLHFYISGFCFESALIFTVVPFLKSSLYHFTIATVLTYCI
jgi:hypothetical protein